MPFYVSWSLLNLPRNAQGLVYFSYRLTSTTTVYNDKSKLKKKYDAVIVGGGHNGLTAAAYLAKAGQKVCVLERRSIVGGAAVTEEIVPGFKFSRASYLLSLFRPIVMQQLELKKHGLRYHIKDPTSFTPMRDSTKSLLLGSDMRKNQEQIAQFSSKDAKAYPEYEHYMNNIVKRLEPLIDLEPLNLDRTSGVRSRTHQIRQNLSVLRILASLGVKGGLSAYEFMTAPTAKILERWFESEPLRATLATDGVIGFNASPQTPGTGYILFHHVMGELDGKQGAWAIVMGGMGAVSQALAKAAKSYDAEIYVDSAVSHIITKDKHAVGVALKDGTQIEAKVVLSNASPRVTFCDLLSKDVLPSDFLTALNSIDYGSPVTKINVAVDRLPNFACLPNNASNSPLPHHQTTAHLNSENMQIVHDAFADSLHGTWSKKPLIEMVMPSSVDDSLAPPGKHVVMLFTQYTPYKLANGRQWDAATKKEYAEHVFRNVDAYCPEFSKTIVGYEVLPPPELEATFGLTGGNLFHGTMSLDQLYFARPVLGYANYRTPVGNVYLCGSGAHPGGGVTGGPGRLAALRVLADRHK